MNWFSIVEQVAPPPNNANRFRIIESFITSEGYRSRLTSFTFATVEEANDQLNQLQREGKENREFPK